MPYPRFREAVKTIIRQCVERLKPDRFATLVVDEVRDKDAYHYWTASPNTAAAGGWCTMRYSMSEAPRSALSEQVDTCCGLPSSVSN
jgi:hypothetical protein